MEVKVPATPIFNTLLKDTHFVTILQGGGDSGKTTSTLLYLAYKCAETKNTSVLITGQDLTNIKLGALDSFQKYTLPYFKNEIIKFNKQELQYYFRNGSKIKFDSFQNEQDARGSERDYLYMNECNGQSYQLFWQLSRKTRKKVILDYNPTSKFWVHDKLLPSSNNFETKFAGRTVRYISNHTHNPYLTKQQHLDYELISDPELKRVYCYGLDGNVTGLIYPNARKCLSIPESAKFVGFGIDYGYTNDPTACVALYKDGARDLYVKELCYTPGIPPSELKEIFVKNGYTPQTLIASEHDSGIIWELAMLGVNTFRAKKNIALGIEKCRQYNIHYLSSDKNMNEEFTTYKFAEYESLKTGETVYVNVPVAKSADHLMDAMRYIIYTSFILGNI